MLFRTYDIQLFPVKLPYGRVAMGVRKLLTVRMYLIAKHMGQIFLSVTLAKIWSEQHRPYNGDQLVHI